MHVTHYLLLDIFSGPAPAQQSAGGAGRIGRTRPPAKHGQGFGFLPETQAQDKARQLRRRRQDDFITLHLLTH